MDLEILCIRPETPGDYAAVEQLTREAFWNVYRPGCTEHYVLHMFRVNPAFVPELDLVLEKDGQLIGHVMYAHAQIRTDGGCQLPVLTFGPISIHPAFQRQGYGRFLLERSMERARALGASVLCIMGDLAFYGQSGFVEAATRSVRLDGVPAGQPTPHFLLKELIPGFLDGVTGIYTTPDGYFVDEQQAEAFDRHFPPKVKMRLPGQLV